MARITIVTTGHPSTSPRVVREADALAAAGHEVTVTGVWLDAQHAEWDLALVASRGWRFVPAADLRSTSKRSHAARLAARARTRVARSRMTLGLGANRHALGYAVDALHAVVRRERPALHVLHLEPALALGETLLAQGARVMLDIEDWYSRITPAGAMPEALRAEVERLERVVFPAAHATTTTSHALSQALASYAGMTPPAVVYNGVAAGDAPRAAMPADGPLRLVWFSQTVAPGRGLELVAEALAPLGDAWTLTVIGAADEARRAWLRGLFAPSVGARLLHLPKVAPEELGALVAAHHVGLALETGATPNLELTVSNKICHYLQCGLAVAATDTAGQREVMALVPEAGAVVDRTNAASLRSALERWMAAHSALMAGIDARRSAAHATLAADAQAARIAAAAERALGTSR
jgi:glycosyltransferase involved in cell wall biosynthesis